MSENPDQTTNEEAGKSVSDSKGDLAHQHYASHSASSYDSAFFYSAEDYNEHLARLTRSYLRWKPASPTTLLDVGGGTGSFTRRLLRGHPAHRAIVVDPYLERSDADDRHEKGDGTIGFVEASADAFAARDEDGLAPEWRRGYDQVLLKEVVHHLDPAIRVGIFRGIRDGLPSRPEIGDDAASAAAPGVLVITRPRHDIDYPLWPEARAVWAADQPPHEEITDDLRAAGFRQVAHSIERYPCRVALEEWLGMVRRRFWSTFASFDDAELDAACGYIARNERHRTDESGEVQFEDRLLFITAAR